MSDDNDMDRRIGARIRIERESRGWSLTELAERASVSRAMIHKVERGDSSPTANLLGKLSGALGLSMSTLMARAEAPEGRLIRRGDLVAVLSGSREYPGQATDSLRLIPIR